jgi:peroxiredoxin
MTFIRQVADSLATAMQNAPEKDQTAATRLARLEKQISGAMKGSSLAAYIVYRRLQADYSIQLLKEKADYAKVQQDWMESLKTFVKDYPKVDEAADALLQLGMTAEFLAKEPIAKTWYEQLAKDFPDKPQAAKARGALKRLDLEGKELTLAGSTIDGESFDISKFKGKAVAVYYWASWNQQSAGDFAKLKKLAADYSSKGFAVVGVNLDTTAAEASSACKRLEAPGVQLHQDGGLECTLATDYGVMVLPNVFLVGKDGKVVHMEARGDVLREQLQQLLGDPLEAKKPDAEEKEGTPS